MKITREEFKELVCLYKVMWKKFEKCSYIFNETLLDELMFPAFNWITEKTGLKQEDGSDALSDIVVYGGDIDKIYDEYLGGK